MQRRAQKETEEVHHSVLKQPTTDTIIWLQSHVRRPIRGQPLQTGHRNLRVVTCRNETVQHLRVGLRVEALRVHLIVKLTIILKISITKR